MPKWRRWYAAPAIGAALALAACGGAEETGGEPRCPAGCTSELRLSFEHPVADAAGERIGTVTAGGVQRSFFCGADGTGASVDFACAGGVVRVFGLRATGGAWPEGVHVAVEYTGDRLAFDGTVPVAWNATCGDACGLGEAAVPLELRGPRPAVCTPSDDPAGCSEAMCRTAWESCGWAAAWDPNYAHCEAATGQPVDDWSHCVQGCLARRAGPVRTCLAEWAGLCADAAHAAEALRDCTCEQAPPEDEAACRSGCLEDRRACDETCPADTMAGCLDCTAECGAWMIACFQACAAD